MFGVLDRGKNIRVGFAGIHQRAHGVAAQQRMVGHDAVEKGVEALRGDVRGLGEQRGADAAPIGEGLRDALVVVAAGTEGLVGVELLPAFFTGAVDAECQVGNRAENRHGPGEEKPGNGGARVARMQHKVQRHGAEQKQMHHDAHGPCEILQQRVINGIERSITSFLAVAPGYFLGKSQAAGATPTYHGRGGL